MSPKEHFLWNPPKAHSRDQGFCIIQWLDQSWKYACMLQYVLYMCGVHLCSRVVRLWFYIGRPKSKWTSCQSTWTIFNTYLRSNVFVPFFFLKPMQLQFELSKPKKQDKSPIPFPIHPEWYTYIILFQLWTPCSFSITFQGPKC